MSLKNKKQPPTIEVTGEISKSFYSNYEPSNKTKLGTKCPPSISGGTSRISMSSKITTLISFDVDRSVLDWLIRRGEEREGGEGKE